MSTTKPAPTSPGAIQMFAFGDAEPVLDQHQLVGMLGAWQNGKYYEPPVSMLSLARASKSSPHNASAINLKRNLLTSSFIPSRWLSRAEFGKFAKDFLALGNAYLENLPNLAGRPLTLKHSPAVFTRVDVKPGTFFFVESWKVESEFRAGSVFHLLEPDLEQEIYGLPEWFAALQSILLNENATLFRRKYYINGAHAGFIMYLNEATVLNDDADAIRDQLKGAKGLGNFKNLFIHAPNGKKDGVQIIPFSEVAARDEFLGIKNTSRDDVIAVHRTPPQLIAVVPTNNGGFGDIGNAAHVFFNHEIVPLQARLMEVNDWLGLRVIEFAPYVPIKAGSATV
jgi:PBSX family phage portal protein